MRRMAAMLAVVLLVTGLTAVAAAAPKPPKSSVTTTDFKFTPNKKGTFEIGCHVEGHYEAGMKGILTVK